MSIDYSSILSKAWKITWKYKVLWFFGFLAMLAGGNGYGGTNGGGSGISNRASISTSPSYTGPSEMRTANLPPALKNLVDQLTAVDINTWITIGVIAACALLFITVGLWLLSIVGRGGLIGGIVSAETTEKVTFRGAWGMGTHYFLRLFVIRVLEFLTGIALVAILILPGIFIGILTCGIGFIPLFCVTFVAGIILSIWFQFMDFAIVVEKLGIGESIGRAWNVLRDHIGPTLIFYIILFVVSLGVGLGLLILVLPAGAMIFLSLLPLITGAAGTANVPVLVVGLVLLAVYILFSIIVGAVFMTWRTAVFTLAYREFIRITPLPVGPANPQPQIAP
jgi:hypothetical protein